ncbi:ATP-binding cassette domain-containing protein [Clostridium sp. MCC353]|uniref:ABC transporter ATP-binding protein n=1 Tax=Clostridium sp. MCC353 TaxID=2592646 RepID=UPI001C00D2C1|nr:ABC transporter ATP-binding protein [Clostridium sp. MCC353]MBT9775032.1 ATP-binding cassette domain-containing protein [Clostridium sp. MCC353]
MEHETAVYTNCLTKQYKNGVRALDGLSLEVEKGTVFSLLGKNGAGKSTLINILTTFLSPTSGEAVMFGKQLPKDAKEIRSRIACAAQNSSIDPYLSFMENMIFQSRLYHITKKEAQKRIQMLISVFELEPYLNYPIFSYSGGIKRRLDLALSLIPNPQILFLDEPTAGMDLQSRMALWDMIRKIRSDLGTTIFLTTHYLEEADQLSDQICIIRDGKSVIQGSPWELKTYIRQNTLKIRFFDSALAAQWKSRLTGLLAPSQVQVLNNAVLVSSTDHEADMEKAGNFLFQNHVPFLGIGIEAPALEDVFLRLTEGEMR